MKSKARSLKQKALKQLASWAESQTMLWLIVEAEGAFDIFHTGRVQRLTDKDDLFYLEPNEGGGIFQVSASECSSLTRQVQRTVLVFCNENGVNLKLWELLETDGCGAALMAAQGVTTPHDEKP